MNNKEPIRVLLSNGMGGGWQGGRVEGGRVARCRGQENFKLSDYDFQTHTVRRKAHNFATFLKAGKYQNFMFN